MPNLGERCQWGRPFWLVGMLIKNNHSGFSLIEILVVCAMLGILASIAVSSYFGYMERAKEKICNINCLRLEGEYQAYLLMEDVEHKEARFDEFMKEYGKKVCPKQGDVRYVNGRVECNLHPRGEEDDGGEGVPFL
ncbi:type IV pilin protein [Desulfotomaculum defluvii]